MIYAIDTETTGVTCRDQVIQLATVKVPDNILSLSCEEILALPTTNEYFNPTVSINPRALEVHGITKLRLLGKPVSTSVALPSDCELVIGHNVSFDLRMLHSNVDDICTLRLARKYLKELQSHKLVHVFEYFYPVKSFKELHDMLNTDKHDALNDTFMCLLVYVKLMELA
jgi:exodeoxyribonuclease X